MGGGTGTYMGSYEGGAADPVLIYSLSGSSIALTNAFQAANFKSVWFDPRTGVVQDGPAISAAGQTVIAKPDARDWLLLLTRAGN